jgi:hypothetical protein
MVKYATALRLGTADSAAILRRFTRENVKPVAGRRAPRFHFSEIEMKLLLATPGLFCELRLAHEVVATPRGRPAKPDALPPP